MKRLIATLWVGLMCLVGTEAHATVPTGLPVLVEEAKADPVKFKETMTILGAFSTETGMVHPPIVGMAIHADIVRKAEGKQVLTDAAFADRNVIVESIMRKHGHSMSWPTFLEKVLAGTFEIPREAIRAEIWQGYLAQVAGATPAKTASPAVPVASPVKTAAVPAASAPTQTQSTVKVDSAVIEALRAEIAQLRQIARDTRGLTSSQATALSTLQGRLDAALADKKEVDGLRRVATSATADAQAAKQGFELAQAELGNLKTEVGTLRAQLDNAPTEARVAQVAEASASSAVALGLVNSDGKFVAADNKINAVNRLALTALAVGLLVVVGLALLWWRQTKTKADVVKTAVAEAKKEAVAVVGVSVKALEDSDLRIAQAVKKVNVRVTKLEDAVQTEHFSFDDEAVCNELTAALKALKVGGVLAVPFSVNGVPYTPVPVARRSQDRYAVLKDGIKGHTAVDSDFQIGGLWSLIRKAVYNRDKKGNRQESRIDPLPTVSEVVVVPIKQAA